MTKPCRLGLSGRVLRSADGRSANQLRSRHCRSAVEIRWRSPHFGSGGLGCLVRRDCESYPLACGDGLGVGHRPTKRAVGLDPFGISPTTTLGLMKLKSSDTGHEHAGEHTDLAIRGSLSLNVGVGTIRGLDDEELDSFAFCPRCGIWQLSRRAEFSTYG